MLHIETQKFGHKFEIILWIHKILAQIAFSVEAWKFWFDRVFNLHRRSLLQHAVVYRDLFPVLLLGFRSDRVSLVATVFFSSAYSFYRDKGNSVATDPSLAP